MKKLLARLLAGILAFLLFATVSYGAYPTRGTKAAGGTNFVNNTVADADEVNTDLNNLYNGFSTGLNDLNVYQLLIGGSTAINSNRNATLGTGTFTGHLIGTTEALSNWLTVAGTMGVTGQLSAVNTNTTGTATVGTLYSASITDLVNGDITIEGNIVIDSDNQLTTADFPNSTTLYGWNMDATTADAADAVYGAGGGGTKIGAKDLTVKDAALASGADVLGNAKYCSFGGTAYLLSTDAAFAFTDDFSIGGWFYSTDWSPAISNRLISRRSGNNGWTFYLETDGTLQFTTFGGSGSTSIAEVDVNYLSTSAWHHFVAVRTSGSNCKLYVDGALVGINSDASDTIVAGGNLEFGSEDGGGLKFTGRLDEAFVHSGTVLTADQVKQIYARSAKKFAVKDQNSNIFIGNEDNPALAPIGSIIPFYDYNGALTFNSAYWAYCDGNTATVGGLGTQTLPDLSNRYLVGFGTEAGGDIDTYTWGTAVSGEANHAVVIGSANLPTHTHDIAHGHSDTFAVSAVALGGTTSFATTTHTHDTDIASFTSGAGSSHSHGVGSLQFQTSHLVVGGTTAHSFYQANGTDIVVEQEFTGFADGSTPGCNILSTTSENYYTKSGTGSTSSESSHTHAIDPGSTTSGAPSATGTVSVSGGVLSGAVTALGTTASGNGGFANTALSIQPRSVRVRFLMRIK